MVQTRVSDLVYIHSFILFFYTLQSFTTVEFHRLRPTPLKKQKKQVLLAWAQFNLADFEGIFKITKVCILMGGINKWKVTLSPTPDEVLPLLVLNCSSFWLFVKLKHLKINLGVMDHPFQMKCDVQVRGYCWKRSVCQQSGNVDLVLLHEAMQDLHIIHQCKQEVIVQSIENMSSWCLEELLKDGSDLVWMWERDAELT